MNTCGSDEWRRLRASLLSRLERDSERGLVDPDIVPLLRSLNATRCLVTSSSCSGRIAVFAAPSPGDKRAGGMVAKWHRRVTASELEEALREALAVAGSGFVWASAQPVIVALHACSLGAAEAVASAAASAGFKYTGYRRGRAGFYLVIQGTERVDVPYAVRGRVVGIDVEALAEILNEYLTLAKAKLERLVRSIASVLPALPSECRAERVG